jgi:hypothetical protein
MSELGRYFVVECKAYGKAVPFDVIAKFARVLEQVRCRFGILFTIKGITGEGAGTHAEAEQHYLFMSRGDIIIVFQDTDFDVLLNGTNIVHILRHKYDRVRLLQEAP